MLYSIISFIPAVGIPLFTAWVGLASIGTFCCAVFDGRGMTGKSRIGIAVGVPIIWVFSLYVVMKN